MMKFQMDSSIFCSVFSTVCLAISVSCVADSCAVTFSLIFLISGSTFSCTTAFCLTVFVIFPLSVVYLLLFLSAQKHLHSITHPQIEIHRNTKHCIFCKMRAFSYRILDCFCHFHQLLFWKLFWKNRV